MLDGINQSPDPRPPRWPGPENPIPVTTEQQPRDHLNKKQPRGGEKATARNPQQQHAPLGSRRKSARSTLAALDSAAEEEQAGRWISCRTGRRRDQVWAGEVAAQFPGRGRGRRRGRRGDRTDRWRSGLVEAEEGGFGSRRVADPNSPPCPCFGRPSSGRVWLPVYTWKIFLRAEQV